MEKNLRRRKKMKISRTTKSYRNSVLVTNIVLIILFLLLIGLVVYGVNRVNFEGARCIQDPISYMESVNNVSLQCYLSGDSRFRLDSSRFSSINLTENLSDKLQDAFITRNVTT